MCRKKIQNYFIKNLKRFALFLFVITQAGNGYSQSKDDPRFEIILETCDCPSRVINTDSVYSFLNAAHLDEFGLGYIFMLNSKPFPIHELKKIDGFRYLFDFMPPDAPINKQARERLFSLFSAVLDSATTFTTSIDAWDITGLPEGWLLYNDKNPIYNLVSTLPRYESHNSLKHKGFKNKKQQQALLDGIRYAKDCSFDKILDISMSVPVFDKDYEYALFYIRNLGIASGSTRYAVFIYRRDSERGWKVHAIGHRRMYQYLPVLDVKTLLLIERW